MKKRKNVTIEELEEAMRAALLNHKWHPEDVEAYVRAQRNCGFLRPETPQDMRDAMILYYYLPPATGY